MTRSNSPYFGCKKACISKIFYCLFLLVIANTSSASHGQEQALRDMERHLAPSNRTRVMRNPPLSLVVPGISYLAVAARKAPNRRRQEYSAPVLQERRPVAPVIPHKPPAQPVALTTQEEDPQPPKAQAALAVRRSVHHHSVALPWPHSFKPASVLRFLTNMSRWNGVYPSERDIEYSNMWDKGSAFAFRRRAFYLSRFAHHRLTTQRHEEGPWLNLDKMLNLRHARALYNRLPPLPTHAPSLEEIGMSLTLLYKHPWFQDKERTAISSHHLERLLDDSRLKAKCLTSYNLLLRRVARIIRLVEAETTKEGGNKSYAQDLFGFLYETENTCIDNAITVIEETERYLLFKQAQSDLDYVALAQNDFLQYILLSFAVERERGDTIEAYRYLRAMCHATLQLIPADTPSRWLHTSIWSPTYSELLSEIFKRLTLPNFLAFLSATLEVPLSFRQRELHSFLGGTLLELLDADYNYADFAQDLRVFVFEEMSDRLTRLGFVMHTPLYPMWLHQTMVRPAYIARPSVS